MATLQKSSSFSLMGTLAANCLLLFALLVQGGASLPIGSHCRLDKSNFQQPYITNHTFMLANEVLISIFLFHILSTWNPNCSEIFLQNMSEIFKNPALNSAGRLEIIFCLFIDSLGIRLYKKTLHLGL